MLEQREEQTVMKPDFKTHFKVLYLLKTPTCETNEPFNFLRWFIRLNLVNHPSESIETGELSDTVRLLKLVGQL